MDKENLSRIILFQRRLLEPVVCMSSFDFVQLPVNVIVAVLVFIDFFLSAMDNKCPLEETTGVIRTALPGNHRHFQDPGPRWVLSPAMASHERPSGETILEVIVVGSLAQNHGSDGQTKQVSKHRFTRIRQKRECEYIVKIKIFK